MKINRDNERPCVVEGCPRTLSYLVPERIKTCGYHQYLELERRRIINKLVKKYNLSSEDKEFFVSRAFFPEGKYCFVFCYGSELARYLRIPRSTFLGYITKKRIETEKEGRRYLVSLEEAARVINLVRQWIPANKVARLARLRRGTLRLYVQKGYLMPACKYFDGALAIKKECLTGLKTAYEDIKTKVRRWANRPGRHLAEGEIDVAAIAARLKISDTAVRILIRKGKLNAEKRKGCYVVKTEDFQTFCQRFLIKG